MSCWKHLTVLLSPCPRIIRKKKLHIQQAKADEPVPWLQGIVDDTSSHQH